MAGYLDAAVNHDPLCPATEREGWIKGNCQCVLIHKVRQDEKDKS